MSFVLNSKTNLFKYGCISVCRTPYIYKFTAIVKVIFHLLFVLTRNVKITGMMHKYVVSVVSVFLFQTIFGILALIQQWVLILGISFHSPFASLSFISVADVILNKTVANLLRVM
jgi:heme A synthase